MDELGPFSVLGVTSAVDAKELRRAYLRLVREHRPERDPEGFRRIREAYEAAQQWLEHGGPGGAEAVPSETAEAEDVDEPDPSHGDGDGEREVRIELAMSWWSGDEPTAEELGRLEEIDRAVSALDLERAVALLTDSWALSRIDRNEELVLAVLHVATGVIWNEPFLYERLMTHHGALVRAQQVRYADGALVHLERCRLGAQSWSTHADAPPALERLLRYGWILGEDAFVETLRKAAAEVREDPGAAYESLVRASNDDRDLFDLWEALLAQRVPDAIRRALTLAEAKRLANDRRVRWRLVPPDAWGASKLAAVLVFTIAISLLIVNLNEDGTGGLEGAIIVFFTMGAILAVLEGGRSIDAKLRSPLYVARRCIELQAPIVRLPEALEDRGGELVDAAAHISADAAARLLTLVVACRAHLDEGGGAPRPGEHS